MSSLVCKISSWAVNDAKVLRSEEERTCLLRASLVSTANAASLVWCDIGLDVNY